MSKEFIKKKIAAFLSWFRLGQGALIEPKPPFKLRLDDRLSRPLSKVATELSRAVPSSDRVLTTEAQQDTYMWQYRQLRTSGVPWEEARRQALELALKVRT